MANKLLWVFIGFDVLFVACGGLLLAVALVTKASIAGPQNGGNVATDLLLDECPLSAAIVNAIFIFVTFVLSIPAIISQTNRLLLKIHGYAIVICAVYTMILGLIIWFETLKTRANLSRVWGRQSRDVQSLLQQQFNCCGYLNATSPAFVPDNTCTNPLVAANLGGCVGPFSSFANGYLDIIFTADFGIVAIDALLVLCVASVLKDRKEKERFRIIDAKVGFAPI